MEETLLGLYGTLLHLYGGLLYVVVIGYTSLLVILVHTRIWVHTSYLLPSGEWRTKYHAMLPNENHLVVLDEVVYRVGRVKHTSGRSAQVELFEYPLEEATPKLTLVASDYDQDKKAGRNRGDDELS